MAEHAHDRVSNKYTQVRTIDVVDRMRDLGWMPVRARQMAVRTLNRIGFCKHEVRFQRMNDTALSKVGDEKLQAIMTNSHDRSSAFIFNLGVYRLVCSNGMVVAAGMFNGIRIRHIGFNPEDILNVVSNIAEGGKQVGERINIMKQTLLNEDEQMSLAKGAVNLLFEPEELKMMELPPQKFLLAHRSDDIGNDLWKTFNRVQENVMKGGIRYFTKQDSGFRRASTRQIKSIDRDIKLNQSLWGLAEEMLESKVA